MAKWILGLIHQYLDPDFVPLESSLVPHQRMINLMTAHL
jgi:hypothetical protein